MMHSGRGLSALVVLTLVWGYSWVLNKIGLEYASPYNFGFLRAISGAFIMLSVLIWMKKPMKLVAPVKMFWLGTVHTGLFMTLQNWALAEGGAGRTSVLIFTMPIWTLFLAWGILGERVRGVQWLAAICTLTGLMLIIAPWSLNASLLGKTLGVLAALCWAAGTIMLKRWRNELHPDLLVVSVWQILIGSAFLFCVTLVAPEPATQWTPEFITILIAISLFSTVLGWFLWLYVLERLPAWQASLSILGVPVVANLSSRLQLGEQVEPLELAGMLLIGGGLALLSFLNWRAQRRLESIKDV